MTTASLSTRRRRRRALACHLVLFAFLILGCAVSEQDISHDELVGGQTPAEGQYASTVYWMMPLRGSDGRASACSGAKVGPNLILTSAHCLGQQMRSHLEEDGSLPDLTRVHAGQPVWVTNDNEGTDIRSEANRYEVTRILFPAGWQEACEEQLRRFSESDSCVIPFDNARGRGASDIALIEVDRGLSGVPTAPIDFNRVSDGETLVAVGYGARATRLPKSRYPDVPASWILEDTGEDVWVAAPDEHGELTPPFDSPQPDRVRRRFHRLEVGRDTDLRHHWSHDYAVSFHSRCWREDFFAGRCALFAPGDSGAPIYRESGAVAGVHSGTADPTETYRLPDAPMIHFRTSGGELQEMLARAGQEPGETPGVEAEPQPIGEVGRITAGQSGTRWSSHALQGRYTQPVVVMGALSFTGSEPAHSRARRVSNTGFEWKIEEWSYQDGNHTTETNPYLVMEAGTHQLEGGRVAYATPVEVDHRWRTVSFGSGFSSPPVVLVGVMSDRESDPVVVRVRGLTATSVQVRLDEEEASDGIHAREIVGLVALEPGSGSSDGRQLNAGTTPDAVTDAWYTIGFLPPLSFRGLRDPLFLGNLVSSDGLDPSGLRFHHLTSGSVQVRVEEERSLDHETVHTTERVGWIVFEGPGAILGRP